jgi:hypothetical protein
MRVKSGYSAGMKANIGELGIAAHKHIGIDINTCYSQVGE